MLTPARPSDALRPPARIWPGTPRRRGNPASGLLPGLPAAPPRSQRAARPDSLGPSRPSYRADPASRAARSPRPLEGGRAGRGRGRRGGGGGGGGGGAGGAGSGKADTPAAAPSASSREIANRQPIQRPRERAGRGGARKLGFPLPSLRGTPCAARSRYGLARESKGVVRLWVRWPPPRLRCGGTSLRDGDV